MKFEYMFWHKYFKPNESLDFSVELNGFGQEGWELVGFQIMGKGVIAYFKRRIND